MNFLIDFATILLPSLLFLAGLFGVEALVYIFADVKSDKGDRNANIR